MYPHGEKALPVNEVRAACVAELHALAYDQFKTTQDYKEYCLSKKDLGEPVEEGEGCAHLHAQRSRGAQRTAREDAQVFDEAQSPGRHQERLREKGV